MYPYWYEKRREEEMIVLGVGFLISILGLITHSLFVNFLGFIVMFFIVPIQTRRFKRLDYLRAEPLRCECGGHFVAPWDIGFDAPDDHLICDNENGDGPGVPCEKWIVNPGE